MQIFPILLSALLSSCFTLLGFYFLFRIFLNRRLKRQLDESALLIKKRLQEGVLEAAKDILPEFREEVRQGFTEALSRALSGEIIPQTARQLAKNSQGIVEQGLSFLLGRSHSPKEESSSPQKGGKR